MTMKKPPSETAEEFIARLVAEMNESYPVGSMYWVFDYDKGEYWYKQITAPFTFDRGDFYGYFNHNPEPVYISQRGLLHNHSFKQNPERYEERQANPDPASVIRQRWHGDEERD